MAEAGMRHEIRAKIQRHTAAALSSFLDELANGTRNYRSLHSLTEQIEHQYHGRFLIELLQNAHDSLRALPGTQGRIAVALEDAEGEHGTLYVANDGRPFIQDDFESLGRLGQSSKDPNRFVGNKGIGFRSVLEISSAPEIYSRFDSNSREFDGFCFAFQPDFVRTFGKHVAQGVSKCAPPSINFDRGELPLAAGWTDVRLRQFWSDWSVPGKIENECRFLSPYLLPVPLGQLAGNTPTYAQEGYGTVIRLPLKDQDALNLVTKTLASFNLENLLFLESANELRLAVSANIKVYRRDRHAFEGRQMPDSVHSSKVSLSVISKDETENAAPFDYWVWSKTMGGPRDTKGAKALKVAASKLPGKWPDVHEALISLAARLGPHPADGMFSIFLPTQQKTGTPIHLNAPFFGEMSRANIPFDEPFNQLLLQEGAKLALALLNGVRGDDNHSATACADLATIAADPQASPFFQALRTQASVSKVDLSKLKYVKTSQGWRGISETAPLPALPGAKILVDKVLAHAAAYPYPVADLATRTKNIERLHQALTERAFVPSESQKAKLVETAIKALLDQSELSSADWEAFWTDVSALLPASDFRPHPLLGHKVLLSGKRLVARGVPPAGRTIFTLPLDDDSPDGGVRDIPEKLRAKMGFMDETVPMVKTIDGKRVKSPLRDYLLRGGPSLVEEFRRRTVLEKFLLPLAQGEPIALGAPEEALQRDVLYWGVRLVDTARGRETLASLLSGVRVPCRGGWCFVRDVSFGAGWKTDELDPGFDLEQVLSREQGAGLDRLVLPPSHPVWGSTAASLEQTLKEAGIAEGIRLRAIAPDSWRSRFSMSRDQEPTFSNSAPSGIETDLWTRYVAAVIASLERRYASAYDYQVTDIRVPHGFDRWSDLNGPEKAALTRVLLRSFSEWPESWKQSRADKVGGESHVVRFQSPPRFALEAEPWITFERDGKYQSFRPCDLLLIPSGKLEGPRWQFNHLDYLPLDLARLAEKSPAALETLRTLGIVPFPGEEPTSSSRFLEALAHAVASGRAGPEQRDILQGQVHTGWQTFQPQDPAAFPRAVVAIKGSEVLVVRPDDADAAPVYLPDQGGEIGDLLRRDQRIVVEIPLLAARRLRDSFTKLFGDRMRCISQCSVTPMVSDVEWRRAGSEPFLADSELNWLPVAALAAAAYAGQSPWGTHTKSFPAGIQTLRRAKVHKAPEITLKGAYGEEVLFERAVGAIWIRSDVMLLIDPTAPTFWEDLSEATADMLGRGDLETSLRLVFSAVEKESEPDETALARALKQVRVTPSQISEVRKAWLGDVSWLIQRLRPAIALLQPKFDLSVLEDVRSSEQLEALVAAAWKRTDVSVGELLKHAHAARNDEDMGRAVCEKVGSAAERGGWNRVLNALGAPYRHLKNAEADAEFQAHLDLARNGFCAVLRDLAKSTQAHIYNAAIAQFEGLTVPEQLRSENWAVRFKDAMQPVAALLGNLGASESAQVVFAKAENQEALSDTLVRDGLDARIDPSALFRANLELCKRIQSLLQKCGILLCEQFKADALVWSRDVERDPEKLSMALKVGPGHIRELALSEAVAIAVSRPYQRIRFELLAQ